MRLPKWLRFRRTYRSRCWYCECIFTFQAKDGEGIDFMDIHYCPECRS